MLGTKSLTSGKPPVKLRVCHVLRRNGGASENAGVALGGEEGPEGGEGEGVGGVGVTEGGEGGKGPNHVARFPFIAIPRWVIGHVGQI
jgi:hypothetical protein